jgi:hypothetical protein
MKELLEVIIKGLVDYPDEVNIVEKSNDRSVNYEVSVASPDMGKIIGKQGKMAKSIRTVMKSVANKEHKRINIEFVD